MFLLFAGEAYYPGGGWSDFGGVYPTLDDALNAVAKMRCDWWHVVDYSTLRIVKEEWK